MGSVSWRTDRSLDDSIRQHPQHFNYYQLVNLLLNYGKDEHHAWNAEHGGLASLSVDTSRLDALLNLRSDIRFDFPPSQVSGFSNNDGNMPPTISVNGFGIAGIYGPLPQAYAEWLYREIADGKQEIADFLDMFNHRLLSLRFQVRARSRVSLSPRRPNSSGIAKATEAVTGFGYDRLLNSIQVRRRLLQTYAGLLANTRTSTQVVKSLIASVFNTPVDIEQLCGEWRDIEPGDRSRIGSGGRNRALGLNTVLGSRHWDQQGTITLTLGPLPCSRLLALMPGGTEHDQLVELIRFLSNRQWDCRVVLKISDADLPPARLQARHPPAPWETGISAGAAVMRLGRTAWLKSKGGTDGAAGFMVRVN